MENESGKGKIVFGIVGVIVIAAALFALWYRSQNAAPQEVAADVQPAVQTQGAQVIEAPKDDPYGKLTIPPSNQ